MISEVPLTNDQASALDAAGRWVDDCRSAVGDALLRVREAQAQLVEAERRLEVAVGKAQEQEQQHAHVLRAVASELNLPPGEWRYDQGERRLVRKESPDAKSL